MDLYVSGHWIVSKKGVVQGANPVLFKVSKSNSQCRKSGAVQGVTIIFIVSKRVLFKASKSGSQRLKKRCCSRRKNQIHSV